MKAKQKGLIISNLIVYLLVLVWVVLFHATLETLNSAFDPDYRTINFYLYFNGFESILNVLIFVPLGLYVGVLFENKNRLCRLAAIIATTLFFEITQYIFAVGGTDIMDIINNSIGGVLGLIICHFAQKTLKQNFYKVATIASVLCTLCVVIVVVFVPLR